jgi:hypothetical protein
VVAGEETSTYRQPLPRIGLQGAIRIDLQLQAALVASVGGIRDLDTDAQLAQMQRAPILAAKVERCIGRKSFFSSGPAKRPARVTLTQAPETPSRTALRGPHSRRATGVRLAAP